MDTRTIKPGQVVYCALHYCGRGIVHRVNGVQNAASVKSLGGGCVVMGGSATFDVIFDTHISKAVDE